MRNEEGDANDVVVPIVLILPIVECVKVLRVHKLRTIVASRYKVIGGGKERGRGPRTRFIRKHKISN